MRKKPKTIAKVHSYEIVLSPRAQEDLERKFPKEEDRKKFLAEVLNQFSPIVREIEKEGDEKVWRRA